MFSLETGVRDGFTRACGYLYRVSDVFAEGLNVYLNETSANIQPCVKENKPTTSALRASFAKAVCLSSRIQFLGIFNA